jgi:putative flippase GtrA
MRPRDSVRRWFAFNGVGLLGVAVQLAVLAALVRWTPIHYLLAVALAVEAAVLHNFVWHQRWTWRDRQVTTRAALLARLGRFHVTNGLISLVGNLAIMRVLCGTLRVDPVIANLAAIITCSLVNFAASDALVFRTAAVVFLVGIPSAPSLEARGSAVPDPGGVTLQSGTLAAWNAYERTVDDRYHVAGDPARPFFALDAFGTLPRWRTAALSGEVAMVHVDTPSPGLESVDVPGGSIHHWIGAVFVKGATLEGVLASLVDRAGHESAVYDDVLASRLIARDGDRLEVYMKLRRASIITVTYNTNHLVEYRRLTRARATSRSTATRIAELAGAGTPREREKSPGTDNGFLWRLNAYWRYEASDSGVLIECESVSLSRSVPLLIRPFVTRTVEGIARDALANTLKNVRRVLSPANRPS